MSQSPAAAALDYVWFPLAAYVLAAFVLRAPEVLVASAESLALTTPAVQALDSVPQDAEIPEASIMPTELGRERLN